MFEELHDEKVKFASNAYVTGQPIIRKRVVAQYPKLNLNFLDEDWEPQDVDVPYPTDAPTSDSPTTTP